MRDNGQIKQGPGLLCSGMRAGFRCRWAAPYHHPATLSPTPQSPVVVPPRGSAQKSLVFRRLSGSCCLDTAGGPRVE
jgi:hypothetical protein